VTGPETKLTLKMGVIASMVGALVIFVMQVLWGHQIAITKLQTNQEAVMLTLASMDRIPVELAIMNERLDVVTKLQMTHLSISDENNKILKKEGMK